ncbi:LacI family DNA-binding transcriptional regulator [Erysipelotrichaceae bacterium 51-3]
MASLKDIADRVGISKAAVSRILNGKGSFSRDTIYKVEKAARELNYTLPSMAAEENNNSANTIGLIVPLSHVPYFGVLSSRIEAAAYDYGYGLLLCSSAYEHLNSEEFAAWLRRHRVSGLIVGVMLNHPAELTDLGLPVVSAGLEIAPEIPSVSADNLSMGRIAARHLLSRGCKNLLYISNSNSGLKNDHRYRGFYQELEKNQLVAWPTILADDHNDSRAIKEMITEMLMDHPEADGIFAESQTLALECVRTLQDLGYRIPEEIKVIGCGSPYFGSYAVPRLTILEENTDLIAKKTVSLLADLIEGGHPTNDHLTVPVSLQINQTT